MGIDIYVGNACHNTSSSKTGAWSLIAVKDGKEVMRECGTAIGTTAPRMTLTAITKAQDWIAQYGMVKSDIVIYSSDKVAIDTINDFYPKRLNDGTVSKMKNVDLIQRIIDVKNRCENRQAFVWLRKELNQFSELASQIAEKAIAQMN